MDGQKISETEALDIIARVFDRNMRRMNYVRGELFIFWGALLSLTALAEYGLYRWTGDMRVLWSWLVPLVCGYIWTIHNSRRQALVRTGFDDLLILIWGMPAMISAAAIAYAVTIPENTLNPVGVTQLLLGTSLAITAEFYRGERLPAIGVVRGAADALDLRTYHGFQLYVPHAVRCRRRDVDARTLRPWHTARTATRFYPPPHNPQAMFKELNPLLHSELRLAVMSILIGVESADFVFIRQQTGATAGNLSIQLDKLAKADYIEIEKTFRGKMPCTVCRITDTGRDAFAEYVAALQTYIKR